MYWNQEVKKEVNKTEQETCKKKCEEVWVEHGYQKVFNVK